MTIEFIKSSEKKEIVETLKDKYGVEKLNFLLLRFGKEKIRGFTGSLSKEELVALARAVNIETVGTYLFKKDVDGIRLSFDAPIILNANKKIIEISDEDTDKWLHGENLDNKTGKESEGFFIIKNRDDMIGCGKLGKEKIANFVPKERRLRN